MLSSVDQCYTEIFFTRIRVGYKLENGRDHCWPTCHGTYIVDNYYQHKLSQLCMMLFDVFVSEMMSLDTLLQSFAIDRRSYFDLGARIYVPIDLFLVYIYNLNIIGICTSFPANEIPNITLACFQRYIANEMLILPVICRHSDIHATVIPYVTLLSQMLICTSSYLDDKYRSKKTPGMNQVGQFNSITQ